MGVWLPLALADVTLLLTALVRMQSTEPHKIAIPQRSETLAGWCLPMLSKSIKAGEDEYRAKALFDAVQRMAERQKAKEAAK